MLGDRPAFGVGVTRFYDTSEAYLADWFKAAHYRRENAHNNVLQIAAELGLAGFAAFAWLVAAVVLRVSRARLPPAGVGATAGVAAFFITSLAGHPLLTREVSFTFWLAFGLVGAFGPPPPIRPASTRVAVVAGICVLLSIPVRVRSEMPALPMEHAAWGVSLWTPAAAGPRTRTVGKRAVFFVPADAGGVILTFRSHSGSASPHTIDILFEGQLANRVTTKDTEWVRVNFVLPPRGEKPFYRVEVRIIGPQPPGADESVDAGVEMGWIRPSR
jgi:hypothetical protein